MVPVARGQSLDRFVRPQRRSVSACTMPAQCLHGSGHGCGSSRPSPAAALYWSPMTDPSPPSESSPSARSEASATNHAAAHPMGQPPNLDRFRTAATELVTTIARLRAPDGCPWDREQTLASIKPHTLEEVHELLEAIDSGDDAAICDELGDVLLQVVLDAQIAADEQRFDLCDVIENLTAKMIRRHPHVFGDETAQTADDVRAHWASVKQREKSNASSKRANPSSNPASHKLS